MPSGPGDFLSVNNFMARATSDLSGGGSGIKYVSPDISDEVSSLLNNS